MKKDKERASPIVIDADVRTFDKFRAKMGYFFGVDQKNIFITVKQIKMIGPIRESTYVSS